MLCVEDVLDTLDWVEGIGGLEQMFARSNKSLQHISDWIDKTPWVEFLNPNKETRSNTGITFKIHEAWYEKIDEATQREIIKKITQILASENIANDIAGYPKAPPSFRVWGGGTVEPRDIKLLLPWIEWAFEKVKLEYNNVKISGKENEKQFITKAF